MLELYLFFTAFMITATVANIYFSCRIALIGITSTITWSLFAVAFTVRLLTQLMGLFYISEIVTFTETFPNWLVLINTAAEAAIMGCFFMGILRTFMSLRKLGIK